jgi:hypothetical protein
MLGCRRTDCRIWTGTPEGMLAVSGEPAAFMSYVHFDNEHNDGQLSEFRRLLSAEVQAQTGQEFVIFQDRAHISWGQNWQRRIDEALDVVTLLLVIVTPGFFSSTACRAEVARFLERERELGRPDLILPLYYITAREIEDPVTRESDAMASVLASRQFADWRDLRFEPFTSPTVRRAIGQLASRMRDSFWQPGSGAARPAAGPERPAAAAAAPAEPADARRAGGVEADLADLWSTAATTLVALMTTDSWERARAGFAGLWRHHRPGQAEAVEADLEAARSSAVAAREVRDVETGPELTAEWRSRLRRAAGADAEFAAAVRRLVAELRPLVTVASPGPVMTARASGSSRINQAGRDQTVTGG